MYYYSLALPIQGTLLDGVDVANSQDADEAQHAPEDLRAVLRDVFAEYNSPRVHKDHLDIE